MPATFVNHQHGASILYQRLAQTPRLSLVIIAHDDPKLVDCIKSIEEMEHADWADVIIVLDASPEAYTRHMLDVVQSTVRIGVRLVCTHKRENKGQLRNRGVDLVSSFMAFIDSDCTLPVNYIACALLLMDKFPIVTGKVTFSPNQTSWFSRENCRHRDEGYKLRADAVRTPNLLVEKTVLQAVDGFEAVAYGEDFLLNQSCHLAGLTPFYAQDLVVYHHDDAHWWQTVRKWIGYGIGTAFRWKRARSLYGKAISLKMALHHRPFRGRVAQRGFHLLYCTATTIGFFYGLWHWRATPVTPLPFALVRRDPLLWV